MAAGMIPARLPIIALPLLPALLLGACASPGSYPSLARRPAERVAGAPLPPCVSDAETPGRITGSAQPAPPVATPTESPIPAPGPGLDSRLAAFVASAREGQARFAASQGGAERLVAAAAGSAVSSDAWSNAQAALAELDGAHGVTMMALGNLDSLLIAESVAHADGPGPDGAAISAARDQVSAIAGQQDAVLTRLRGRLR
jgi:hypothetical protein